MIVPMQPRHAARVAEIHCAALAGDFLPSLGTRFLTTFYRGVFVLNVGFGFVWVEHDEPVGFVLGTADGSLLFKRIAAGRALRLGWQAASAIVRRPLLLVKVLETFLYPSKEDVPEKAELVVISLDASHRDQGRGRQLVNALEKQFCAEGVHAYKVTVLQSNHGANRFYQGLGFQPALEFELYRKKWNLYTRALSC